MKTHGSIAFLSDCKVIHRGFYSGLCRAEIHIGVGKYTCTTQAAKLLIIDPYVLILRLIVCPSEATEPLIVKSDVACNISHKIVE